MKTWKLWALLFCLAFGACDDDEKTETGTTPVTEANRIAVSFEQDAKTVLKNAGIVQIPVVLAEKAEGEVKVTIGVKQASADTIAQEGIDFNISEKVINIPAGNTMGYVQVELLNDEKTGKDKTFELTISGAYGYGKPAETKQSCKISIVSNAFVEFEKPTWTTWESAAGENAPADWKASCQIPLIITGEISAPATIVIQAADSTANEYYHFTVVSKEITVNPGDTKVYVDILPIDDDIANDDRKFNLIIKEIKNGNLIVGKNNLNCEVSIISEEVKKTVSFENIAYTELDNTKTLEIPVIIDKVPDNDVTVTLAPTVNSTAVEGVDYELTTENRTLTIGASKRTNVIVTLLGDNIVNGDRQLVLALRSVKGSNAYLSETESLCTIDINNDDFPAFEKNVFEIEEAYGSYNVVVAIPPVNKDRVMKFTIENTESHPGTYFQNVPSEVTIPANASEVNINMTIGTNIPAMASVTPTLKINITEVDRFILQEPITTELQVVECTYRKLIGDWTFTAIAHNNAGPVDFSEAVSIKMASNNDFGKVLTCTGKLREGWNFTWQIRLDSEKRIFYVPCKEVVCPNVGFTPRGDVVFAQGNTGNRLYGEIPLTVEDGVLTWNMGGDGYLIGDICTIGTTTSDGRYWFKYENVKMTKK